MGVVIGCGLSKTEHLEKFVCNWELGLIMSISNSKL